LSGAFAKPTPASWWTTPKLKDGGKLAPPVKLRWTDGAVEDLRSAYEYLEAENPQAAIATTDRIVSAVEDWSNFHKWAVPAALKVLAKLVVTGTPFIVAYRLKRDSVHVLAVLHGARKWPKKF